MLGWLESVAGEIGVLMSKDLFNGEPTALGYDIF